MALCGNISVPVWVTDLVEASKDATSLYSKKIFLRGGCGFFMTDVISGGLLGHLSPLCLTLGANR